MSQDVWAMSEVAEDRCRLNVILHPSTHVLPSSVHALTAVLLARSLGVPV